MTQTQTMTSTSASVSASALSTGGATGVSVCGGLLVVVAGIMAGL